MTDALYPSQAPRPKGGEQEFLTRMLAYLKETGLARSNRFYLFITLPAKLLDDPNIPNAAGAGEKLLFMCEEVSFPGRQIATTEQQIYGPTFKMPHTVVYPETSMTFRVSNSMFERTLFDKWQELIIDPHTHNSGYYDDYVVPIEIYQANTREIGYDRHGPLGIDQPGIKLIEAYPVSMNALPFSTTRDNAYHQQTITFNYHRWHRVEATEEQSIEAGIQFKKLDPNHREKQGGNFKPGEVARRVFGNLTGI